MRYGFTKTDDSFVVVDDERRLSAYAYFSSTHWRDAKKDPERTARKMLSLAWTAAPEEIREAHYLHSCDPVYGIGPKPERAAK